MKFKVVLQRHARRDIWGVHGWIAERAPLAADKWLDNLQAKIKTLEDAPDRCPLVAERHRLHFDVRELLHGHKPYIFRIIFVIDGRVVRILRIRRGQRRNLTEQQLKDALSDDDANSE